MGRCLLVLLALLMLGYRLVNLDLLPFINDEPRFLAAAHGQLGTGQWLSASPVMGTQGMYYGPSVFWFYGVVQLVLARAPAPPL